ncbi:hypothetical protein A3A14_01975 [Candidatus Daviesbacteria bacterium RIFCSPLOWO2_01_FULL_43_38]|uniref:Glycosyltransferase RgtA/B/C/D-like domain-containing protein n=2 Tax=Candidatus Daviesiibacteriota TaxID=1752718 RepID=A0A0G1DPH0_9BACT|nr:MAG: hypothetical protein UV33_C0035G0002 [Candidatus Daviesbacteria bacterium GW2011_GWA1_42_6]KKS70981.1 MAG: hypothetical protein UV41_C0008G0013 [Candidatus Daviesbacteria bacterium GW2011_GWA2_42_7]OGE19819.1 MAG: hypothetical protein A2874_02735 [Candidatus Daviesbacteria bacterium RIFCSPHIGHO2_01_FULL_43_17]OGE63622.1 MAG: hypothetical protein A3A14_01975 [Candidatus Daviesbacteria bacterium RIFCSPLOWO2_01_FULL_43_38]
MKRKFLIILGVSLGNFWVYQLFANNILMGLLLTSESILLFLTALPERSKKIQVAVFIILTGLSLYLLAISFNKEIFYISDYEKIVQKNRGEYFGAELGKIYGNKAGIFYFDKFRPVVSKISGNFASNLDFEKYFLSKNPEEGRYPVFLLPLFILGLVRLIIVYQKTSVIYFLLALIVSSLVSISGKMGPMLLFPFFNLCIALGALNIWRKWQKDI